jgi:hypothetical protein
MTAYRTNPLKKLRISFLNFLFLNRINHLNFLSFESFFSFQHLDFLFILPLSYRICLSPVVTKGAR